MPKSPEKSAPATKPEWFGVGERLATLRAAFNQSQRDVAAETNWVHTTVSRLEREESTIDLPQLVSLAKHFKVEMRWLATGKGPLFESEDTGIVYLGSAGETQPCRAAVELMLSSPAGQCVLLEEHLTEVERYGWALRAADASVIVLPGEVKPGYIARALVDFALKGWGIRGSFDVNKFRNDALSLLENKAVPNSMFQQWFTLAPHRTDLADLWERGTPPALADSVRPIFERLKAQEGASKEEKRDRQAAIATELRKVADRVLKSEELANQADRFLKEIRATDKSRDRRMGA